MIYITKTISIKEDEIKQEFIHASGPGGQNVNKVATSVQLRFDVRKSSLPDEVKNRLISIAGNRITKDQVIIITAQKFSKQDQNRHDAVDRLIKLIHRASEKPKKRNKTKPTFGSKIKRLKDKRCHTKTKQMRNYKLSLDE